MDSKRMLPPLLPQALLEDELSRDWASIENPEVTVWVASYNHSRSISRCLDGIFSQITEFPFEVVVRDDFSADGTRTVLEAYQLLYPKLLRLIYTESNQWLRDTGWNDMAALSKGSLIALVDGDDYWCEPKKLARQYEAFCLDPNVSLVSCSGAHESVPSGWKRSAPGGTSGWMFRKSSISADFIREANGAVNGDIVLKGWLETLGSEECLDFVGYVWERNEEGITLKFDERQKDLWRLDAHVRLARLVANSERVDLIFRQRKKIERYLERLLGDDNRLVHYERVWRRRERLKWLHRKFSRFRSA